MNLLIISEKEMIDYINLIEKINFLIWERNIYINMNKENMIVLLMLIKNHLIILIYTLFKVKT